MNIYGLIFTLVVFVAFIVLVFRAYRSVERHNNGTDSFMAPVPWSREYREVEQYHCSRGNCNGMLTWEADRKTHDNYHDHVDNGMPNPYGW